MARWLLLLLVCFPLLLTGCGLEGELLLKWTDEDAGITFEVRQAVSARKTVTNLLISRQGKLDRLRIAEDVDIHDLSLLRYNDWLLVLSGPYVLGGYDYAGQKLRSATSPALPYTYHTITGYVVANVKIGEGTDQPPAGWIERRDR